MKRIILIFAIMVIAGCTSTMNNGVGGISRVDPNNLAGCDIVFISNMQNVAAEDFGFELYCMKSDGTEIRRITSNSYFEGYPDVSPTRDEIVTQTRFNNEDDTEIVIWNFNGSIVKQVTDNNLFEHKPRFSPDGNKIVFFAGESDKDMNIYTINRDGTGMTKLSAGNIDGDPAFTPGDKIIFSRGNKIMSMRQDGTLIKTLYELDSLYPQHLYAIDESTFLFDSDNGNTNEIYLIKGNNVPVDISNNDNYDAMPQTIGGKVIFSRISETKSQIVSMNKDGTTQKVLLDNSARNLMPTPK